MATDGKHPQCAAVFFLFFIGVEQVELGHLDKLALIKEAFLKKKQRGCGLRLLQRCVKPMHQYKRFG